MAKALGKIKRMLSVLLAIAMLVTALPQTNMSVYAAEEKQSEETMDGEQTSPYSVSEDDEKNSDDAASGNLDQSDGTEADDQSDLEDGAVDQNNSEAAGAGTLDDTETEDQNDSDAAEEEDASDSNETDIDGETDLDAAEEDETTAPKELTEDDAAESDGMLEDEQNESGTEQNAVVRVYLPYYMSGTKGNDQTDLLSAFSYAVGDTEEFTALELPMTDFKADISVKAGSKLRFKFNLKDHAELRSVKYYTKFDSTDKTDMQASGDVYEITIPEDDSFGEYVYDYAVEIDAKHTYSVTFLDVYAGEHDGTKSVKLYQQTGDDAELKDVMSETVVVAEDELADFFSERFCYAVEAEEGYTFQNIDFNTTQIRRSRPKEDRRQNVYYFSVRNAYSLPEDIKVYVMMEQTQSRQLQFNIPDELKDKMTVAVYGRKPGEEKSSPLEGMAEDGSIGVPDDMSISFDVTLTNGLGYSVSADYQENDGPKEKLERDDMYQTGDASGWICGYSLGTLKNGDVTVNLLQTDVHKVIMKPDWEVLSELWIGAPFWTDYNSYDENNLPPSEIPFYLPAGEKLYFNARTKDGKGDEDICIAEGGMGELSSEIYDDEYYDTVLPHSDLTLCLGAKPYEYKFDYLDSDAEILVYDHDTDEQLELSDTNRISSYKAWINFRIMVKPAAGKSVSVAYNSYDVDEGAAYAEREPEYDKDGYLCYLINGESMSERTVRIEGNTVHTVKFDIKNRNLSLERKYYDFEGSYWDEMLGTSIQVTEGSELCFRVEGYDSSTQKLKIDLAGADDDCLTSYWDGESACMAYRLIPTVDLTVTIDVEERRQHTITLKKGEGINNCWLSVDGSDEQSGPWGSFKAPEDAYILITQVSWESASTDDMARVVCTVNGESYEVVPEYTGNQCQYGFYVTGDMTVEVGVKETAQHTLSFNDLDKIESIQVWKYLDKSENLYQTADGQVSLRSDTGYHFDFQLKDGLIVSSVIMKDKTSGSEKVLERMWNYDYESGDPEGDLGYPLGVPCGDMEIIVNTVSGYTVRFDVSKAEGAEIFTSPTAEAPLFDLKMVSAITDDTFFYLDSEERYKLSIDSELFTLKRVKQVVHDMDGEVYEVYVYMVTPSQTENLPAAVTVSVEEYEQHKIRFDYSDSAEIKNISLSSRNDNTFWIINKEATVYGTDTVLAITPISGYAATVSIQGSGDEETLSPYRVNGSTHEYFLGELTEDKTIRITVARSSQKQTYYEVGFLSPGGRVTVREPRYHTEYEVSSNTEDYAESYSIPKGSSITFYVEPAYNYALDGVYANGKAVVPVYDENLQRNVYTVTPTTVTQIKINTSRIVEKYPITFTYPDTVSAVTVKDYILTENMLNLPAGTKLCVSVGIADPQYKVDSVKMNDKDVPYNRSEGCYILTTLAEPMEVVITTCEAGETGGEEDKKALEACIDKYKDYEKTEYTEESWTAFEKALKDAQACMSKADADKDEIAAAIAALEKAAGELVKKGSEPDPGPGPGTDPEIKEGLWFKIQENHMTADGSYVYTGSAFKPAVEVYNGSKLLTVKKDYTVSYKNNTNAGTATVTVSGKGNYTARDTAEFEILKKDINDEDITVSDVYAVAKANGTVVNPKVTVKFGKKTLKNGTDYKVVYPREDEMKDENGRVKPGTYQITITTEKVKASGGREVDSANYTGTRTISYDVVSSDTKLMSKAKVTLSATKVSYKGNQGDQTEIPTVTSVKIGNVELPKDAYTISEFPDNWNQVGKASITVTASGKEASDGVVYFGSKTAVYTVEGTKLAAGKLDITGIEPTGYVYTGRPIFVSYNEEDGSKGTLSVKTKGEGAATLVEGTDYTVSYKTGKVEGAHTNVGTVAVTITGIGAYTGTVKKNFKITPYDLESYREEGAALQFTPAGEAKAKYTKAGAKPLFDLTFHNGGNIRKLVEKTDYTVSYSGNAKVKTGEQSATMTIKGKGNFKGKIIYKYEVTAASAGDVEAIAADIAVPNQFNKLKTTVKVVEKETGKALKARTDYDKNITYYSDAACTVPITAENFKTLAENGQLGVDSTVYVKVTLKADGSYAGTGAGKEAGVDADTMAGQLITNFRLYDNSKKISVGSKFEVKVSTDKTADGINRDNKGNPIYTGKAMEPKVIVTPKGGGVPLTEGVDYEVTYSNNINKGKATATVTAIGNGYGGSKSVKFTIVSAPMSWAKQAEEATKKALEMFSELMLIPE